MSTQKFTEEELKQISELQQSYFQLIQGIGELQIAKMDIEASIQKANENLAELRAQEQSVVQELSKKYGNGTLNLQSGEFTPSETSEDNVETAEVIN